MKRIHFKKRPNRKEVILVSVSLVFILIGLSESIPFYYVNWNKTLFLIGSLIMLIPLAWSLKKNRIIFTDSYIAIKLEHQKNVLISSSKTRSILYDSNTLSIVQKNSKEYSVDLSSYTSKDIEKLLTIIESNTRNSYTFSH